MDIDNKIESINNNVQTKKRFILCKDCNTLKAVLICESCNKPCCPLCIKSNLLLLQSGKGLYNGYVTIPLIIKRCQNCNIKDTYPTKKVKTEETECLIQ